jgi:hypothetical protein
MLILAMNHVTPLLAQTQDAGGLMTRVLDEDLLVPVLAIVCGSLIAIVAITSTMIRTILVSRAKEQSRRELAAYVAEGTLEADRAISLLDAGKPAWDKGERKPPCS